MLHKDAISTLKTLPSSYLSSNGGTLKGGITFANATTGSRGIIGTIGDNDAWRIIGAATGSDKGYVEISTADNGDEPIYLRQYESSGLANRWDGSAIKRTATLLDGNGNTTFPGVLKAQTLTSQNINTTSAGDVMYCNAGSVQYNGNSGGNLHFVNQSNMNNSSGAMYIRTNGEVVIRNKANDSGSGKLRVKTLLSDSGDLSISGGVQTSGKIIINEGNAGGTMRIGTGTEDVYIHNQTSNKYLQLKANGKLTYSGKEILTTDNVNKKITVSSSAPSSPSTGDIWIKA